MIHFVVLGGSKGSYAPKVKNQSLQIKIVDSLNIFSYGMPNNVTGNF